jgi:hypothetical protein
MRGQRLARVEQSSWPGSAAVAEYVAVFHDIVRLERDLK